MGLDRWEACWAPYDEDTYGAVLSAIDPDDVVLDIGAGDLRLAKRMARVARRVIAWEIQTQLPTGSSGFDLPSLVVQVVDARMAPIPSGVSLAVLLMRHCRHYAQYVAKLRAAGCRRLITNARWRMGVEVIDLQPSQPFASVKLGWYACRCCGATGFVGDDPTAVTEAVLAAVADVEGCPACL